MAKGDDIACLEYNWQQCYPEGLSWSGYPHRGTDVAPVFFPPKVTSAVLPVVPRESVQYQFHWPRRKPPSFCQVTNHARPSTSGVKGRTCFFIMYHSWAFRLQFQPNTLNGRQRDLHYLTNSPRWVIYAVVKQRVFSVGSSLCTALRRLKENSVTL